MENGDVDPKMHVNRRHSQFPKLAFYFVHNWSS